MQWEYIGYSASILLIMSLAMSDVYRLRWFNLAGCVVFTVYGVAIAAWPVALTNALLAVINCYHLFKLYQQPQGR